jgi:hypothetical protein
MSSGGNTSSGGNADGGSTIDAGKDAAADAGPPAPWKPPELNLSSISCTTFPNVKFCDDFETHTTPLGGWTTKVGAVTVGPNPLGAGNVLTAEYAAATTKHYLSLKLPAAITKVGLAYRFIIAGSATDRGVNIGALWASDARYQGMQFFAQAAGVIRCAPWDAATKDNSGGSVLMSGTPEDLTTSVVIVYEAPNMVRVTSKVGKSAVTTKTFTTPAAPTEVQMGVVRGDAAMGTVHLDDVIVDWQ